MAKIITIYKISVDENEKATWIKAILCLLTKTTICRTTQLHNSCFFKPPIKHNKTVYKVCKNRLKILQGLKSFK